MERRKRNTRKFLMLCAFVVGAALSWGCDALKNLLNASPADQQKVAECYQACVSKCETAGGTQDDCMLECGNQIQECMKDLPNEQQTASQQCDSELGTCMTACVKKNGGEICFQACKSRYEECLGAGSANSAPQDCVAFKDQCAAFCKPGDLACLSKCDELQQNCQQASTGSAGSATAFPTQPCDLMRLECTKQCSMNASAGSAPTNCLSSCGQRFNECMSSSPAQPVVPAPDCQTQMDQCTSGCSTKPYPETCLVNCDQLMQHCQSQAPSLPPPIDDCGQEIDQCAKNCVQTNAGDTCYNECKIGYQNCLNEVNPATVDPCLTKIEGCMAKCQLSGTSDTCYINCKQLADQCHADQAPLPPTVEPCQQSLNICVEDCSAASTASAPDGACLTVCKEDFISCVGG